MSIDIALLERAARAEITRPVLRFYRWDGPSLSLGAHQRLDEQVAARCAELGVQVVKRPTGGAAVLHGKDLTYSVVAPHGTMGVLEAYREVAGGLIAGLALLGIEARIGTRHEGPGVLHAPQLGARAACFAVTLGADLQVGGAKICGSAQLRRRGWFLQHGSIPIGDDRAFTNRILDHPDPIGATCLEHLRPGTSEEELCVCLRRGFESRWGEAEEVSVESLLVGLSIPA